MASLIKYQQRGTFTRLNRKVRLRDWRRTMGDLDRQANQEDSLESKVDLNQFMKNPMEVFSKANVQELEMKLREKGNLQREYIDDIGLNQSIVNAPTNDIEDIKKANAKALEWDSMLSPDASLVSAAKNLDELRAGRKKKMRDQRRMMRK